MIKLIIINNILYTQAMFLYTKIIDTFFLILYYYLFPIIWCGTGIHYLVHGLKIKAKHKRILLYQINITDIVHIVI